MKKLTKRFLALFMGILLLLPFAGTASFTTIAEEASAASPIIYVNPESEFVPGEIIVVLREAYYEDNLAEIMPEIEIAGYEDLYASVIEVVGEKNVGDNMLDGVGTMFTVTLEDETEEGVINALDKLRRNSNLISASPNYLSEPCSTTPNDTYYSTYQWGLPKISAPTAWDTITDSTVRIAVLDSGFYTVHTDLDDVLNLELAYNSFTGTLGNVEDTAPIGSSGHGTHVAGIIAAEGNNNSGVCGVAWDAEIVPIRISGSNGHTSSDASRVRGILYALALDIKLANLSYDLGQFSYPMLHALGAFSRNDGIIVIAAGNEGKDISSNDFTQMLYYYMVSANSGVILVGASNENDGMWSTSNYSSTLVDVFAPGDNIYSTHRKNSPNGRYGYMDGTSMAAPFVTGAIALLMSEYPDLTAATIKEAIIENADYVAALDGKCVANGRLNIAAAMDALIGVTDTPLVYTEYSITVSQGITNGVITPSVNSAPSNMFVFLAINPNQGYWLKPGTLAYNNTIIDNAAYNGNDPFGELAETDNDGCLYTNYWYFEMPSSNVTITAEFYMIGDVDDDGSITVSDVLKVLRYTQELDTLTEDELIRADVDGDGDVDGDDAQYIGDYSVGNITVFPIEA